MQSADPGEPKPLLTKLRTASPFQISSGCKLSIVADVKLGQMTPTGAACSGPSFPQSWRGKSCGASGISLELLESQDRLRLAHSWVGQAKGLAKVSAVFLGMDGRVREDDLLRLFLDRAPSTLKRHLSGWRAWASFCTCMDWQAGAPKLAQLMDFLRGLAEGAALDRGRGRVASAQSVLSAITFTAQTTPCLLAGIAGEPSGAVLEVGR